MSPVLQWVRGISTKAYPIRTIYKNIPQAEAKDLRYVIKLISPDKSNHIKIPKDIKAPINI